MFPPKENAATTGATKKGLLAPPKGVGCTGDSRLFGVKIF